MTTSTGSPNPTPVPPWTVQAVFDPDGGGADFAYTIGLADLGQPELHIWARPSLGDDPGLDWKFSVRDCCGVLNELAVLLVSGELRIGSTLRREYDGGLAVVEFRVDPPGNREELEAYGAPAGADVLPVRWSLSRPPAGPALLVEEDVAAAAHRQYDALCARLQGPVSLPRGWVLPEKPSFHPDQPLGPFTPLVLARAAQLGQADVDVLMDFLAISGALDEHALTWPIVRARALGRPAGRTDALDNLHDFVERLLELWTQQFATRMRWKAVVDGYRSTAWSFGQLRRAEADRRLLALLHSSVESCLAGEVAFDVADDELRLAAAGAWQAAAAPDGRPGREWTAPEDVIDRVAALLEEMSLRQLYEISVRHIDLLETPEAGDPTYGVLTAQLRAMAVTSAALCPEPTELVIGGEPGQPGPPAASVVLEDAVLGPAVADWLRCLTALLVHRHRLCAHHLGTFVEPFADVVPALPGLLPPP